MFFLDGNFCVGVFCWCGDFILVKLSIIIGVLVIGIIIIFLVVVSVIVVVGIFLMFE